MHSNAIAQVIWVVSPPTPLALIPKSLRTSTTTQEICMLTVKKTAQSKKVLHPLARRVVYFSENRVLETGVWNAGQEQKGDQERIRRYSRLPSASMNISAGFQPR
jgi:hypothetical protein